MRLVIAPDSFKDCLSAIEVADAMALGASKVDHAVETNLVPMVDGGQGTLDAILRSTGGVRRSVEVVGPLGKPVTAQFGLIDDGRTAVFEMASASGLELVPPAERDARVTTTYGTGQLLVAAIEAGAQRVLIGIGGSATNDGGAGLAEALGFRLLDRLGRPIPRGGGFLDQLDRIDPTNRRPELDRVQIDVACDVTNPLTGPSGASAVYGPQKGATPEIVPLLDRNLAHLAAVIRRDLLVDVESLPGGGAAGGLGAGLVAFAAGKLRRGVELVIDAVRLREKLEHADLCMTGEGAIDFQSAFGKTAFGVASLCKLMGVPCVAMAGAIRGDMARLHDAGLAACFSVNQGPTTLEEAIADARRNVTTVAEQVVRLFLAASRTV